jgi:eukaryotic-like serine/threonine-protein kinase
VARAEPVGAATTARDQLSPQSRYELLVRVASGGMATVYVGRISGAVGFRRLVAIKRAHAHLLEDPAFGRMLVAEARLASLIHHPNVCSVQDVEELEGEILLVMDYVEGSSLAVLLATAHELDVPMPPAVGMRIVLDACAGLHAAHEVTDENGAPLRLVHRDVSPHNVLIGLDGVARLADFGIAKVAHGNGVISATSTGLLKGKVAYMAPEYVETSRVDARGDVFALGVVAWEALTQKRLFKGVNDVDTMQLVLEAKTPLVSAVAPHVGPALDAVIAKALTRSPETRFQSALAFGEALEAAGRPADLIATPAAVGAFVRSLVGATLEARRALIRKKLASTDAEESESIAPAASASASDAPGGRETLTLSVAPSLDSADAKENMTTLATGAAAISVGSAYSGPIAKPKNFVPLVAAILTVITGLTGVGLVVRRATEKASHPESLPSSPSSSFADAASPPKASGAAPTVSLTSAVLSPVLPAPLPAPAPSPPREYAGPPPASAPPRVRNGSPPRSAAPRPASAPRPAILPPPPPPPPPSPPPLDLSKAPPNPYGI